jgi:hypothetical protein
MNSKLLNEIVHRNVKKVLNEAMSENFSFDMLKSISSFRGRLKYCMDTLGLRIGTGSSRTCFQLDDNRLLKLALNAKGIAQNAVESRLDYNLDSLGIRPEIYEETDYDNNFFIVCEYVLPAKAKDFQQTLGMSWSEFRNFIGICDYEKRSVKASIDWDAFYELLEDNDKLWSIHDYIANYDAPTGDLLRLCNYGLSKTNGIVILDTGLDDYVLNTFYR